MAKHSSLVAFEICGEQVDLTYSSFSHRLI